MTLGEKIRAARKKCALSQGQLAEMLSVSRSAIAKWETDKGLPDVGNLKLLARLLNVSVDNLLDEEEAAEHMVIREPCRLAAYGPGCTRVRKDRILRERFPEARIYPLFGRREQPPLPLPGGNLPHCTGAAPALSANADPSFYLVEKEEGQFLVTAADQFLEIRLLESPPEGNSFTLEGWHFIRYQYALGEE